MKMMRSNRPLALRARYASNISHLKMTLENVHSRISITYDGVDFIFDKQQIASFTIHGDKYWRLGGTLHRTDGPAIEYSDGTKKWYINGELHRTDGPAVESAKGKYWYFEGKLHRDNGPAIELSDSSKFWFYKGKLHRKDGPAIEYANGDTEWFLEGKRYGFEEPVRESLDELNSGRKE